MTKEQRRKMMKKILGLSFCKNSSQPVCLKQSGGQWKERVPGGYSSDHFVECLSNHPDVQAFLTEEFKGCFVKIKTKEEYFYTKKKCQIGIFAPQKKKAILKDGTIVETE